jgi:hypothetical protein
MAVICHNGRVLSNGFCIRTFGGVDDFHLGIFSKAFFSELVPKPHCFDAPKGISGSSFLAHTNQIKITVPQNVTCKASLMPLSTQKSGRF